MTMTVTDLSDAEKDQLRLSVEDGSLRMLTIVDRGDDNVYFRVQVSGHGCSGDVGGNVSPEMAEQMIKLLQRAVAEVRAGQTRETA